MLVSVADYFPPIKIIFRITLAHRIEMVNREIEEMKKALVEAEAAAKKKKTRLLAQIEEMEIRIKETEEAKRDFEEFVSQRGVDPNTGKVSAEKFVKYLLFFVD